MKTIALFLVIILGILSVMAATYLAPQQQNLINQPTHHATLSPEAVTSLESRGFEVSGQYFPVRSPRSLDSTNLPETVQIKMSVDLSKAKGMNITWIKPDVIHSRSATQNDTILIEDFEGEFPGTTWQLSGNPTWGKTGYQKHGGSNSVWCAAGGDSALTPPANYPNNMDAMMVFGPFNLSDASLAYVRFWYWLETEINKDWFWYMASEDGINFDGIGISGFTSWEQSALNLGDLPRLGNFIGKSSVWVAFGFTSDSSSTDRGVFLDDVEVQKASTGTGISGYLKGSLSPAGNPYIAFDHVGVAQGDSLSILPGCELRFDPAKEFVVHGLLNAQGTEIDSIRFTSNTNVPKPEDWTGIGFYSSSIEGTIIQYARIEYGGGKTSNRVSGMEAGMFFDSNNPILANCYILDNKEYGILCEASPLIRDCKISNNATGIRTFLASPRLINNLISNNDIGIWPVLSDPYIENNVIENNNSSGISSNTSDLIIVGNTIKNNGNYGISAGGGLYQISSSLTCINNIIIDNNGSGIEMGTYAHIGNIIGNIIKGNKYGVDVSGIYVLDPYIKLVNNAIVENEECGIYYGANTISHSIIMNNIISSNNKSGIEFNFGTSFYVWYNDFYNNNPNINAINPDSLGILSKVNRNGYQCDPYFNILLDPLFLDPSLNDYHLQQNSPCINSGNPSVFFNDLDGTINDIGAFGGSGLYLHPTSYDFGKLTPNTNRSVTFHIANYRNIDLNITDFQISDQANFSVANSPKIVFPYKLEGLNIIFKPQNIGYYSTILKVHSDDFYGANVADINLHGNAIYGTLINGSIWGTWTKDKSPYIVQEYVHIPKGKNLTIEPGVQVCFLNNSNDYYLYDGHIIIEGILYAVGTETDSIIFTKLHQDDFWTGLYFKSANDSSRLEYCIVENSDESGIQLVESNITIKNCMIRNNHGDYSAYDNWSGGGIYCNNSSPIIINNLIINNITSKSGGGISLYSRNGEPIISNNTIYSNMARSNGGGIYLYSDSTTANNNLIFDNFAYSSGGGVYLQGQSRLINNTIIKNKAKNSNGGGLYSQSYYPPPITNSIIYLNDPDQINTSYLSSVSYSDIQGGYRGEGNIDADPLFVDIENNNFHLQLTSPCIDAGNPDSTYNDPEDPNNPDYAMYPSMGTIRNDMGAYGGPGAAGFPLNQAPMHFNLLSPNNQDTIFTIHPTLTWQEAIDLNPGDKVTYTIYYDTDSTFTNATLVSGIFNTSFQIQHLKDQQTYLWKIKAEDNSGASTFSNQVFQFFTFAAPLPFKLLSPAAGDTVSTDTLHFAWQSAFDLNPADSILYTFVYDTSRTFTRPNTISGISDTTFTLTDSLENDANYFWTVVAIDNDSFSTASSDTFHFLVRYLPTTADEFDKPLIPQEFALSQNYPNPFNPVTTIKYQLPEDCHVTLKVFNAMGQEVATLVNKQQKAGYYSVNWNVRQVASGLYFYWIKANEFSKVCKMILLR